jgi:hypothetical protein
MAGYSLALHVKFFKFVAKLVRQLIKWTVVVDFQPFSEEVSEALPANF